MGHHTRTHLTLHSGAAARDLDTGRACRVVAKVWGGGAWTVWFPDDDELVKRSADKLEAIEAPPNLPRRTASDAEQLTSRAQGGSRGPARGYYTAAARAAAGLFSASLRSSIVDDVKEARDGGLLVWSKDGKRVIVLDPVVFVEVACQSGFGHNRLEIFEGQLRAYGFDCVARDSDTEVAGLGWPRALEFKHSSFCRDGGLLEAKQCGHGRCRTATGAARLRYVLETCELPEGFEVTKENARAILDMFREKNGGRTIFKLDDTEVRVHVKSWGGLGFLSGKRAAATPAPSSPKKRRVLPVDAPQMQEALSDVLQKGTLPGVASLDGKGASLTSAAAVSQIGLAADAIHAASTLELVTKRYNTDPGISASPPVAAKLGALPGDIEGDLISILGQRDEIDMILKKHTRDFENARYMLPGGEASSLIKVWSGHDVHTNLPAMASLSDDDEPPAKRARGNGLYVPDAKVGKDGSFGKRRGHKVKTKFDSKGRKKSQEVEVQESQTNGFVCRDRKRGRG